MQLRVALDAIGVSRDSAFRKNARSIKCNRASLARRHKTRGICRTVDQLAGTGTDEEPFTEADVLRVLARIARTGKPSDGFERPN